MCGVRWGTGASFFFHITTPHIIILINLPSIFCIDLQSFIIESVFDDKVFAHNL